MSDEDEDISTITRKQILSCYRFYSLSEVEMVADLGDKEIYGMEPACEALEKRITELFRRGLVASPPVTLH